MENNNLTETFREEASKIIEETFLQIKDRYKQLVDLGHSYNLTDFEIDLVLQDLLKPKVNPRTLYNYRREFLKLENISERKPDIVRKKQVEQSSNSNQYAIPQPAPNIVDVEPEPITEAEPIIQQERRTPEAPDNSMVQQLHHINIKLKKELQDLEELMDMRMADKDKRIHVLVKDVLDRDKAIQLLTEENTQLKAELGRHRRLEELRLEAQRKAIKQWNSPGDKP